MLLDRIPHTTRLGRLLRRPLRWVPPDRPRPILTGPAAGLLWYPASGPHGMWLGLYERKVLRRFGRLLSPEDVVWDVGAHAGLFTLLAAHRGATVHAFEPLPDNAAWISRHLELNGLAARVRVWKYALGAHSGSARFHREATRMEGRVAPLARDTVAVYRADDLRLSAPTVLKIDVEGEELNVLRGAAGLLATARPLLFLETHAPVSIADCLELLPEYGAQAIDGVRFLCRPTNQRGNADSRYPSS
ncbi:MAG TPA: FkbM family methyltransferase [Longimicrobiales bacterium]